MNASYTISLVQISRKYKLMYSDRRQTTDVLAVGRERKG